MDEIRWSQIMQVLFAGSQQVRIVFEFRMEGEDLDLMFGLGKTAFRRWDTGYVSEVNARDRVPGPKGMRPGAMQQIMRNPGLECWFPTFAIFANGDDPGVSFPGQIWRSHFLPFLTFASTDQTL